MVISGGELDYGYSYRDLHVHKASASRANSPVSPGSRTFLPTGIPTHKHCSNQTRGFCFCPSSCTKHHITPTLSLPLLLTVSDAAMGAGTHCPLPVVTSPVTHSPSALTMRIFGSAHQFSHVISSYCSWMCLCRNPYLGKMFSMAHRRSWE